MQVKNFTNNRGRAIPNQFIIETENGQAFQSYDSIIARVENGQTYIDEKYWDYSKTTGKYRNLFLGETKKETEKKIASGEYTLTNLQGNGLEAYINKQAKIGRFK